MPRLRIVTPKEVDDLAKLNEPVEAQAREQAMEIVNDIKVKRKKALDKISFSVYVPILS